MVGIPGRSGGCHNCRRRKVKCDKTKPACERCSKFGRVCEGYDHYAVFIDRTPQGIRPRKRLEEARISTRDPDAGTETYADQGSPDGSLSPYNPVSSASLEQYRILGLFLESFYASSIEISRQRGVRHWLEIAVLLPDPSPALKSSLQAVSFGHVGVLQDDKAIRMKGREFYSRALKELQKALLDGSDTTLCACKALTIYEMLAESSEASSFVGLNNHQRGMESLIRRRGPQASYSELGKSLVENIRESSLSRALSEGDSSFFDSPEWAVYDDNYESRLIELGFKTTTLHHDVLQLHKALCRQEGEASSPPPTSTEPFLKLIGRGVKLSNDIESWWSKVQQAYSSPIYWEEPDLKITQDPHEPNPFTFVSFPVADMSIKYWTGLILLLWVRRMLRDIAQVVGHGTGELLEQLSSSFRVMGGTEAARCIFRAMPYFLQKKLGVYASNRATFTFRTALAAWQSRPGNPNTLEVPWLRELQERFTKSKGLPLDKVSAEMFCKTKVTYPSMVQDPPLIP